MTVYDAHLKIHYAPYEKRDEGIIHWHSVDSSAAAFCEFLCNRPLNGLATSWVKWTTQLDRVTCKTCLKIAKKGQH